MKTAALFAKKKTVLSYEVFPPKPTTPVRTIYDTLDELKDLSPDFISVTYGAGGGGNNGETFRIASAIRGYGIESVVHLPCIGLKKADVLERLNELKRIGVENVLALRGDLPDGGYEPGDFRYASELVAFLKGQGGFNILGACYPEGHPEAASLEEDIRHLKLKVDAGADHLITQLFFDNNDFYAFMERCRKAGINVPVEAGIMPVTNKKQIDRMASLCGASIPRPLAAMMERYQDDPVSLREAGIAYAAEQILALIGQGVDGIHLYTMNNPYIAKRIYGAIRSDVR